MAEIIPFPSPITPQDKKNAREWFAYNGYNFKRMALNTTVHQYRDLAAAFAEEAIALEKSNGFFDRSRKEEFLKLSKQADALAKAQIEEMYG